MTEKPNQSNISREGLVAEYRFTGNANDTSGGGHHGVVHGATLTVDRFGNRDSAYAFDGKDAFIVVAPPPPLSDGALSASVWVRYDKQKLEGWSNCIICQDDGNDDDQSKRIFQLSTWWNRIVWHRMVRAADPTAKLGVRYGAWCHVVAVYEGGVHRLYVDGAVQDSTAHPLSMHADEPIYIGRKGTPEPFFFFRGAIDDVRLYNRALAADEVRALFAEGGYQRPEQPPKHDSISGTWETEGGDLMHLRFDGRDAVTGRVTAGGPGNPAAIKRGTFDPSTGSLRLEGHARRPDNGAMVPYVIEGTLDKRILSVRYAFDTDTGHATLARVTPWRAVRRRFDRLRGSIPMSASRRRMRFGSGNGERRSRKWMAAGSASSSKTRTASWLDSPKESATTMARVG